MRRAGGEAEAQAELAVSFAAEAEHVKSGQCGSSEVAGVDRAKRRREVGMLSG